MTSSDDYAKLSDDTRAVKIYPDEEVAQEWEHDIDDRDISLSRYLQNLINEGCSYRQHGLVKTDGSQRRIRELQGEVAELQKQLEQQRTGGDTVGIDAEILKHEVLTDQYQTLDEVLQAVVESGVLNDVLLQPVEDKLYFLAAQDEAEYERGWGWKLAEDFDGGVQ